MDKKKHDSVQEQIKKYIASQPEPKRSEMQALHQLTLQVLPACKLWFSDGKNSDGKTIANPNIGYGFYTIKYTDGTTREGEQGFQSKPTTDSNLKSTTCRRSSDWIVGVVGIDRRGGRRRT